jgi:DNA ligase-1
MLLADIVNTHQRLSQTRSRKAKAAALADVLQRLGRDERRIGAAYLSGELPQGRIGLGPAMVGRVDVPPAVASRLDLTEVDRRFSAIGKISGAGAQAARQNALAGLYAEATADEQRYLGRLVLGELRQGALEGLMIDAIAKASGLPLDAVRRATMLSGDLATVAVAALNDGAAALAAFRMTLFQPLQAMLAQPADSATEAVGRLGEAALEYKLDGARIQVHRDGERVRVYTRQLHEVTDRVPEIVDAVLGLPCRRIMLDGEAIALNADGRPRPFQETMRRFGRRRAVNAAHVDTPLSACFFDCLLIDDDELIDRAGAERDRALRGLLPRDLCVARTVTDDAQAAGAFLQQAIVAGHEGIMAKSLSAPYQAGNRGADWLKIKPTHSLDLVVLAAEWGSGRRTGRLSNLHLGARDPATNGFVMLGKTFKGLTDQLLAWQTEALLAREIGREGHVVHVRPELVVEIAFNELQRSPHYPAGLALRFARVKRYRPDKAAGDADTIDTIRQLHRQGFARPAA